MCLRLNRICIAGLLLRKTQARILELAGEGTYFALLSIFISLIVTNIIHKINAIIPTTPKIIIRLLYTKKIIIFTNRKTGIYGN